MIIETNRLFLREYKFDDYDALYEIVSDAETMQHYPALFDEEKTRVWIKWNLENYEKYGFGLWAVVLKETGEFIGDCGITIQNIDGELLPEIGYHIHKKYWRRGFAKEALTGGLDYAIHNGGKALLLKAWYTIQSMAYKKGLIKETYIGNCHVMFFDILDIVSLYAEELKNRPFELWGIKE